MRILLILLPLLILSGCAVKQERLLSVEGAYNVRDLGGYAAADGKKVRWGMVYRAGDLHNLTDSGLRALESRDIVSIVDFRTEREKTHQPHRFPATVKNYYELPADPGNMMTLTTITEENGAQMMMDLNRALVNNMQEVYREFFAILQNPENVPLLFNCSAGKDRTGFAAALFLSSLGVARAAIYRDYLLSADYVREKYRAYVEESPALEPVMTVRREYLAAAFEEIDRKYGGVDSYLTVQLGVDLKKMRAIYIE